MTATPSNLQRDFAKERNWHTEPSANQGRHVAIRGMAEEAVDQAKRTTSIEKLMNATLAKGEEVLAQTPDMLEVLKRAGY